MNSRSRNITVVLLILLLVILGIWRYSDNRSSTGPLDSWSGSWKFFYYYTTDTNLVYTGELQVRLEDSLAQMSVLAPRSNRPEKVKISGWSVSDEGGLSGIIVHDLYRIRGGHPSESFELHLVDDQSFEGKGRCVEFCAEGTEGVEMIWRGTREPVQ